MSFREIAEFVGRADHKTVHHAISRGKEWHTRRLAAAVIAVARDARYQGEVNARKEARDCARAAKIKAAGLPINRSL